MRAAALVSLWMGGAVLVLAGIVAAMAAAPLVGVVVFPAWFLWELTRSKAEKESHRQQIEQQQEKVDRLIEIHLLAHGLPNTYANRVRVLQALARRSVR